MHVAATLQTIGDGRKTKQSEHPPSFFFFCFFFSCCGKEKKEKKKKKKGKKREKNKTSETLFALSTHIAFLSKAPNTRREAE